MNYDDKIPNGNSGRVSLMGLDKLQTMSPEQRQRALKKMLKRVADEAQSIRPQSSIELADLEADA
jgi:hypothetical protein